VLPNFKNPLRLASFDKLGARARGAGRGGFEALVIEACCLVGIWDLRFYALLGALRRAS